MNLDLTNDELMTVAEVAEILKISEKTVRRYVADSRLIAYYAGPGNIRVKLSSVENLLRSVDANNTNTNH